MSMDMPYPNQSAVGMQAVGWRPDGKIVCAGFWDGKARIYSGKSMNILASIGYHSQIVNSVTFSPEKVIGKYLLAIGSRDGRISLWDLFSDDVG